MTYSRQCFLIVQLQKDFAVENVKRHICVCFGLAEHFKKAILSEVKGHFVIMFEESLNQKMQEKQLDIHVRYWGSDQKAVVTTYLGSQFMGKFFVLIRNIQL